jgi:hypothetical protein
MEICHSGGSCSVRIVLVDAAMLAGLVLRAALLEALVTKGKELLFDVKYSSSAVSTKDSPEATRTYQK